VRDVRCYNKLTKFLHMLGGENNSVVDIRKAFAIKISVSLKVSGQESISKSICVTGDIDRGLDTPCCY